MSCKQRLYRALLKYRQTPVDACQVPVKFDQLQIFLSPWVCSPAVGICPAADACLIPVVKGRGSRPCHLDDHGLTHHTELHTLLRLLRSHGADTAHHLVCPGEKPGMVMVGQLVHSCHHCVGLHTAHVVLHGIEKCFSISPQAAVEAVAVLFHTSQEPCHRLHKGIIIHDRVPLVSLKPWGRIPIVLRKYQSLRIGFLYGLTEFAPEGMVVLGCVA